MKTWNKMSSRERDALVAEKVMGLHLAKGTPYLHDRDGKFVGSLPKYTEQMDLAWRVLQHIASQFNPKSPYDYEPFNRLTDELFGTESEELYPSYAYMARVAQWTPERICLAALRAMGCEIEKEVPSGTDNKEIQHER